MPKDEKPDLIAECSRIAARISEEAGAYSDPVLAHLLVVERAVGSLNATVEHVASYERATARREAKNIALGRV